jgi:hypothetical protein
MLRNIHQVLEFLNHYQKKYTSITEFPLDIYNGHCTYMDKFIQKQIEV